MNIEINVRYFQCQDFDGEIWKRVKGYRNYYISDHGRVKSKETGKIVKPITIPNNKNIYIALYQNGNPIRFNIKDLLETNFKKFRKVVEYREFKYSKNSEFIYDAF